jgi:hypothetical protein
VDLPDTVSEHVRKRHTDEGVSKRKLARRIVDPALRDLSDLELDDRNARVWATVQMSCQIAAGLEPDSSPIMGGGGGQIARRYMIAERAAARICRERYGIPPVRIAELSDHSPEWASRATREGAPGVAGCPTEVKGSRIAIARANGVKDALLGKACVNTYKRSRANLRNAYQAGYDSVPENERGTRAPESFQDGRGTPGMLAAVDAVIAAWETSGGAWRVGAADLVHVRISGQAAAVLATLADGREPGELLTELILAAAEAKLKQPR